MKSRTAVGAAKTGTAAERKKASNDQYNRLWARYAKNRDIANRNALIEAYIPIVRREARKVAAALSHAVTPQELEGAGTLGLIDSISNFDPGQGFKFVTFCTPRVRGAMLDELRSWDWTPRATRAKLNRLERVIKALEGRFGRTPDHEEIAREMGASEDEVRKLFSDKNRTLVSLDRCWGEKNGNSNDPAAVMLEDKRGTDPVGDLQKKEVAEIVRNMLSKTERLVVTLYYYEQFNLREIGHVLRLTESRICQIHSQIVQRLKKRFA